MSVALVTGASGGIGAAISQSLALRGATLALHYQSNRQAAEECLRSLSGAGHFLVRADLADPQAVAGLWQEVCARGHCDVVINNAGIFPQHPPLTTPAADWISSWQSILSLNLLGPAYVSYFALRTLASQRGGRIVNVTSRAAFRGEPEAPAYAASKAGLNALSQSLAKALAAHNVLVFAVAPGWVATPRVAQTIQDPKILADQPLGRVATPEEVAQVVTFCALDAPVSLTGAILDVNGASYLRN